MTKPHLKLTGGDGNAFSVIASAHKAAKQAGWTKEEWEMVRSEALDGNYNHLLCTIMKYFEVE